VAKKYPIVVNNSNFSKTKIFCLFIKFIFQFINIEKRYLSISIVNNMKMKKINEYYRCQSKSSDHLSFPLTKTYNMHKYNQIVGEVILSKNKIIYQSSLLGINMYQELAVLMFHGILHLLEFNHEINIYEKKIQIFLETLIIIKIKIFINKSLYNKLSNTYTRV